jgi:hypothetical protein
MSIVYIGIDDTDVPGSPGTGRVARGLARSLEEKGLAKSLGVSRHQLLVDDRIKYTSHNSAKGIAIEGRGGIDAILDAAREYMREGYQTGADPGLCLCEERQLNREIIEFGYLAARQVVEKATAINLAARHNIILKEFGGTGDGVIGALAAVGLRAGGNDGRLVDLRGIHDIKGIVTVADLLKETDIDRVVVSASGSRLADNEKIDSQDRIRPSLVDGKPVLKVEWKNERWIPIESKAKHQVTGEKR